MKTVIINKSLNYMESRDGGRVRGGGGGSHALGTEQSPTRRTKTTFLSASVLIKFPRSTTVLSIPSPEILHLKLF